MNKADIWKSVKGKYGKTNPLDLFHACNDSCFPIKL